MQSEPATAEPETLTQDIVQPGSPLTSGTDQASQDELQSSDAHLDDTGTSWRPSGLSTPSQGLGQLSYCQDSCITSVSLSLMAAGPKCSPELSFPASPKLSEGGVKELRWLWVKSCHVLTKVIKAVISANPSNGCVLGQWPNPGVDSLFP